MAIYTINSNDKVKINFAPSTTREEVIQNVRTLINTIKWSIPLARDVGISGDVIDMPILQAKARLSQEIFDVISTYEPRAVIQKIDFDADLSGRLTPKISITINEQ